MAPSYQVGPAKVGPLVVKPHELAVAFLMGGVMGLLGYYLTRKLEGPAERLVNALTGDNADD